MNPNNLLFDYDVDAPKFHDFAADDTSDICDDWFEKRNASNISNILNENTVTLSPQAPSKDENHCEIQRLTKTTLSNNRKVLSDNQATNISIPIVVPSQTYEAHCEKDDPVITNNIDNGKVRLSHSHPELNNLHSDALIKDFHARKRTQLNNKCVASTPLCQNFQQAVSCIPKVMPAANIKNKRSSSCSKIQANRSVFKLTMPKSPKFGATHSSRVESHKKLVHKEIENKKPISISNSCKRPVENVGTIKSIASSQKSLNSINPILNKVTSSSTKWTATVCKPFNFCTDEVHERHAERLKQKLIIEDKTRKQQANFHAKPASVLLHAPFKPHRAESHTIKIIAPKLNTVKRAEERHVFDILQKKKRGRESRNFKAERNTKPRNC